MGNSPSFFLGIILNKYVSFLVFVLVFFGTFLFGFNEFVQAASLPSVNTNSNTKLLEVGGVYYYAFTSSTIDGTYHLFLSTSTNGGINNWSAPVDVFNYGVFSSSGVDSDYPVSSFGFDYNPIGGYFGAAIYATGTTEIWFASSTNGGAWSSTSTVVSDLSTNNNMTRRLFLNFLKSENFVAVFFQNNYNSDDLLKVASSTDNGKTWSSGSTLNLSSISNQALLSGGKVSGSGSNYLFQVGYFNRNSFEVLYASSTNGGVWTTTTLATNVNFNKNPPGVDINFNRLTGFDVDSDGLPAMSYYHTEAVSDSFGTTSTIVYARKSSNGVWATSTILSDVFFQLTDNAAQSQSNLYFFNGDKPIFTGLGSNFSYLTLVNTSSSWVSYNLNGSTLADHAFNSSVYSTSSQVLATSFVLSDGSLKFATTSLSTYAPTTTPIYPAQILPIGDPDVANISVTTTVSDLDGDRVDLFIELSEDGLNWASTTINSASASVGSITTSTSHISGIDTSSGGNNIYLNVGLLPGMGIDNYVGPAYVRITPSDNYYIGSSRVSNSFNVDLAQPTAPGNLGGYLVSTSSVILNLPSTTSTDTNFSQYKIFYSTTPPVTVTSSAFTSSSDVNLGNVNFNGAVTTTITGLSPSTTYYFKIFAFDSYNHSTSSVAEFSTTTLDYYSGTLPTVNSDSKTKLLLVGGVYYLAFSSSTSNGDYRMYVVSSASGVEGTWSRPVDVFGHGIFEENNDSQGAKGNFGFDYNPIGGYFGAAIYATSTDEIWFVTSTNASSWSATTTAVSGLNVFGALRKIDLFFSKSENLASILYNHNNNSSNITVSYSTNNGGSWSQASDIPLSNGSTFWGGGVSGSGLSRVFKLGYFDPNVFSVVFVSSTDNGVTWSTSTVAFNVNGNIPGPGNFGFEKIGAFNLDDDGLPGFIYYQPVSASGSGPYNVTSTVVYAHMSNIGVWTTSSLALVSWSIEDSAQRASDLVFYNTNKPIFSSLGSNFSLVGGFNDGSGWTTSTITSSVLNHFSDVGVVANTSSNIWAVSYVMSSGTLHFTTSSLSVGGGNSAPTVTSIYPSFASNGSGLVTVTTTVTDANGDQITLNVDYSIDGGSTWASSTLGSVSGDGTPTTSTGRISNITSTADGNALTFIWNSQANGVTTTASAKLRITPSDATENGSIVTSNNFIVDNEPTSAPTISNFSISTTTLTVVWGDVSGASNYTVSSTAASATTTTNTSTTFSGLNPNTSYSFQVKTSDAYGNISSYSSASSTITLAATPGTPSAASNGQTSLVVSWSDNSNSSGTIYELYNVTLSSVVVAATTNTTYTVNGLTASTAYQFKVRAQYSSNSSTWTDYSGISIAVSTAALSSGGGGGGSYYYPPAVSTSTTSTVVSTTTVGNTVISTSTAATSTLSGPVVSVTAVSKYLLVSNPTSKIIFTLPTVASYQPGALLNFSFKYGNDSGKKITFKVVRQLLDSKGNIVKNISVPKTLKANGVFVNGVKENLSKSLKPGDYTVKVMILGAKNKILEQNSFQIEVEKLKKKYFSLGVVADENSDINFVSSSLERVKSNLVLPNSFNYVYSYPLLANKKQTVRLTRDLLDPNGKLIESIPGRWTAKLGQSNKKYVKQTLANKMISGDYQIRIRVFDDKSKELLAENSLSFGIELK